MMERAAERPGAACGRIHELETRNQKLETQVIAEALTWLNTPYHHGARVKGAGVDCGQFPAAVFAACGLIPEIEIEPYPHDWHMHRDDERYLRLVEAHFCKVDGPPQPGDIAMFRYGRAAAHGSIVIEWPAIIHAYLPARAVVLDDALANQDLAPRLAGFYRLSARPQAAPTN